MYCNTTKERDQDGEEERKQEDNTREKEEEREIYNAVSVVDQLMVWN